MGVYCQLLSINERQFLLCTAFLATLFIHSPTGFQCLRVNRNYPYQFTWHLHSTEVILDQLITAWFIQQDGKTVAIWEVVCTCTLLILCIQWRSVTVDGSTEQSMC
jgi:hypothetical protein